jgi:hypothetical protein
MKSFLLSLALAFSIVAAHATTVAPGPGAGTGAAATLSATATNTGGLITVTTGYSIPSGNQVIATVTFSPAFPSNASAVIHPANQNAAYLPAASAVFVNTSKTAFTIISGSGGVQSMTTYVWQYVVSP